MSKEIEDIEAILKTYAYDMLGKSKSFQSETRICGDLGVCDEDLWEMIDYALKQIQVSPPTRTEPLYISMDQNNINFRNLSEWIWEHSQGVIKD